MGAVLYGVHCIYLCAHSNNVIMWRTLSSHTLCPLIPSKNIWTAAYLSIAEHWWPNSHLQLIQTSKDASSMIMHPITRYVSSRNGSRNMTASFIASVACAVPGFQPHWAFWDEVERAVSSKTVQSSNIQQLCNKIISTWYSVPAQYIELLQNSCPGKSLLFLRPFAAIRAGTVLLIMSWAHCLKNGMHICWSTHGKNKSIDELLSGLITFSEKWSNASFWQQQGLCIICQTLFTVRKVYIWQ